ncbi:hypothetical protein D3C83_222090 [compost metagenome]
MVFLRSDLLFEQDAQALELRRARRKNCATAVQLQARDFHPLAADGKFGLQ